jgi:hypothetical protein
MSPVTALCTMFFDHIHVFDVLMQWYYALGAANVQMSFLQGF